MKSKQGAAAMAWSKRSRSRLSDSPEIPETISVAASLRIGKFSSPKKSCSSLISNHLENNYNVMGCFVFLSIESLKLP